MPGWRTVQSYTAMTAFARWRASPDRTSCRSRALVTSFMVTWPTKRPSARCPRLCSGLRSARWRSPTTGRMVSLFPGTNLWVPQPACEPRASSLWERHPLCSSSLCLLQDVTCHSDTKQPESVVRCGSDVIPGRGKQQRQRAPEQHLVQRETFILLVHQEGYDYIFQKIKYCPERAVTCAKNCITLIYLCLVVGMRRLIIRMSDTTLWSAMWERIETQWQNHFGTSCAWEAFIWFPKWSRAPPLCCGCKIKIETVWSCCTVAVVLKGRVRIWGVVLQSLFMHISFLK